MVIPLLQWLSQSVIPLELCNLGNHAIFCLIEELVKNLSD